MFYECFSERLLKQEEWCLAYFLEAILAGYVAMLSRRERLPDEAEALFEIGYYLGKMGFPPGEVEYKGRSKWVCDYLREQIAYILRWLSEFDMAIQQGSLHPRLREDVFQHCLHQSDDFRKAIESTPTWFERQYSQLREEAGKWQKE